MLGINNSHYGISIVEIHSQFIYACKIDLYRPCTAGLERTLMHFISYWSTSKASSSHFQSVDGAQSLISSWRMPSFTRSIGTSLVLAVQNQT